MSLAKNLSFRDGEPNKNSRGQILADCLFLGGIVSLSLVYYLGGLGFYSDDWSFLGYLHNSQDKSLLGLFRSINSPQVSMRPVQLLYLAILYKLIGLQPLGYHFVNWGVLATIAILFYLSINEFGLSRRLALSIPLIYILLPHYSTDRFWVAAFQANLSIAFYFLSLYSDFKALSASSWGSAIWKTISVISLVISVLAYEVILPFFVLNPFLVAIRNRRIYQAQPGIRRAVANPILQWSSILIPLAGILVFKTQSTVRMDTSGNPVLYFSAILARAFSLNFGPYDYGLNFKQAFKVNFGELGVFLPGKLWILLSNRFDTILLLLAGILGVLIAWYIIRSDTGTQDDRSGRAEAAKIILFGLIVFLLGYAIFLTNYNVLFTSSGIGNRTAIAAAIGVAFTWVGGIEWLSSWISSSILRKSIFAVLVSLVGVCGFLVVNTLSSYWVDAYRKEIAILADIQKQFPTLPSGSSLVLDGICPYEGPAVVFESSWDLAGALMVIYRDTSLSADVVTPVLQVREDGLYTRLYDTEHRYPYGKLILYNYEEKKNQIIQNSEAARRYFENNNPDLNADCPEGREGHGVPVF